jgi:xylan 1,4-beta-xylosidase
LHGKNYATGKTGSPLDHVLFHAKGSPKFVDDTVVMGIETSCGPWPRDLRSSPLFPELKGRPVFIGESDPEGCAGCSSRVSAERISQWRDVLELARRQ